MNVLQAKMNKGRPMDPVWQSFTRIPKGSRFRAKCIHCGKECEGLVARLKGHLEKCNQNVANNDVDEGMSCYHSMI